MNNSIYDKKKAHEYYMRHRKLKGRHSTKGMSQGQKEQFSYAKHVLGEERKKRDSKSRETINESKQRQREQIRALTKKRIEALRDALSRMDPYQRMMAKERIQGVIENLRAQKSQKSKEITQKGSAQLKSAKQKSRDRYDRDLDTAYKKIKGN